MPWAKGNNFWAYCETQRFHNPAEKYIHIYFASECVFVLMGTSRGIVTGFCHFISIPFDGAKRSLTRPRPVFCRWALCNNLLNLSLVFVICPLPPMEFVPYMFRNFTDGRSQPLSLNGPYKLCQAAPTTYNDKTQMHDIPYKQLFL